MDTILARLQVSTGVFQVMVGLLAKKTGLDYESSHMGRFC